MTADLQDLFDRVGRSAPTPTLDPDVVLDRARRSRNRRIWMSAAAVGVAAAAVGVVVFAAGGLYQAGPLPPTHPSPTPTPWPRSIQPLSVHLLAGSPGQYGFADGNGAMARFDSIGGLAVGPTGTVYVSDYSSTLHRSVVRAITPAGHVATIANEPTTQDQAFGAVAVDGRGTVYVAVGHQIRRIGRNGQTSTAAGATPSTSFDSILGMAVSPDGHLDVAGAGLVREVDTHDGTVLNLPDCTCWPGAIAVGLTGTIYIGADDYLIRKIERHTTVSIVANGAANVLFSRMSLAVDPHSVLWVMDTSGLHTVAPDGTVSSVRLTGSSSGFPLSGIAIGANGAMYALDEQSAIVTLQPSG